MTPEQRFQLRVAIIAGETDCPMNAEEAAIFLHRSHSFLRETDMPRADIGGPLFLKSEILKYVKNRLSHRIMEQAG